LCRWARNKKKQKKDEYRDGRKLFCDEAFAAMTQARLHSLRSLQPEFLHDRGLPPIPFLFPNSVTRH
jgi:hypothetical protein